MQVSTPTSPIQAFNERAKIAGWTVTCGPAQGFKRPELALALALWKEKAGSRTMPARSDMTARDMKSYLSQMSLIERLGTRYRARLHGTTLASYAGDKSGLFLDDVLPADLLGSYTGIFDAVIEIEMPIRVTRHYQPPEIDYLVGESLVAPLSVPGKETPVILSVTYAEPRSKLAGRSA